MATQIEYFGIRHHGPGSSRRLLEALETLAPAKVLIEGPADLSDLIPLLAQPGLRTPVAMLAYPKDAPDEAIFYPFAEYSPEYQAALWALRQHVPVHFIDLPVALRLAEADEAEEPTEDVADEQQRQIERDPIGVLAGLAGYDDGESWWQHVIEENPEPGPIFAAVADAMGALRAEASAPSQIEAAREAHMRLDIAKHAKDADGPVAVICGAWHVPALKAKHTAKDDRALLRGAKKRKICATFTPWTAPRLTRASGYGAGVAAPGWNLHLWQTDAGTQATKWIARIARALRAGGHVVSTASLIETERLALSLAALRGRPTPGFDDLREAAIACMCFGNPVQWQTIAAELLIGSDVGAIPDDVPLAPLLEDLQRQQKQARLKPEALERELSLDLRSESGLFRSTLLHRLNALEVPWGQLQDPGRSRGTFRERWVLRWQPEFAVQLVENLVYGATILQAASGRIAEKIKGTSHLGALSDLVFLALTADLKDATAAGIAQLEQRAVQTSDCQEMLSALPALADVLRYGKARTIDTGQLGALFERIALQGAISLEHAARNLDQEAAEAMRQVIRAADRAMRLLGQADLAEAWRQALGTVAHDARATRLISGQAARLLYEADEMSSDDAVALLARMLSPGTSIADAAGFFEGFLEGAGSRLIHDKALRDCVSDWLMGLEEEPFVEHLPLFRRVFSGMDAMERQRLMDAVLGQSSGETNITEAPDAGEIWPDHLAQIARLLKGHVNG
ncbi:MAG: DUF5682 family protein [Pseudomonadota bacterium]